MRMVVDLPAPFGPRNPKISPFASLEADVVHGAKVAKAFHQILHDNRVFITHAASLRTPASRSTAFTNTSSSVAVTASTDA